MKKEVLIIDNNQGSDGLEDSLKTKDYSPILVNNVDKGLVKIEESENLKVVLLNVELSGEKGLGTLKKIKGAYPDIIVIVIRAGGQTARKAMSLGALEVLSKLPTMKHIHKVLDLVFERLSTRKRAFSIPMGEMPTEEYSLVGESEIMFELQKAIGRVADNKISVLLEGEPGTGKGLVARLIHQESDRAGEKFVTVDCGALPDPLLENELFGHVAGAFAGARPSGQPGRFELADGGTLFLDEVGNMSPTLQMKLLNVLQTGEVTRLGATRARIVDVRVISATNQKLEEMVAQGEFRLDLFHRLCGYQISLPPLRERMEDIPLLVAYFLQRLEKEKGKQMYGVSKNIMRLFQTYNWPGNVRELENHLESAAINSQGDVILLNDLPQAIWDGCSEESVSEMRASETPETPIYENLLDLPPAVFCQLISDGKSEITGSQIIKWWKKFSDDGSIRADKAKRKIDNWLVEYHTSWLTFSKLSERIRLVIDDAVSKLSELQDEEGSKLIAKVQPISIAGRTLNDSLIAVLPEVVKAHHKNKEKAAKELNIDLKTLEAWLSRKDDGNDTTDSPSTSTTFSRPIELVPHRVIKRLLIEPLKLFVLDPFLQSEWQTKDIEDKMRIVYLDLQVISKRLQGDHGCIYFGGMTFGQIERNIYHRAPHLYANHIEAARALGVDPRTFRGRWPKEFPDAHTLLIG